MITPDEEVANNIIEMFRKEKILSEKGISKLLPHLSSGKLRAEDWILAFEIDRPIKEVDNASQSQ